jgi:uncharacterized membrane protein (UPF0136 family)
MQAHTAQGTRLTFPVIPQYLVRVMKTRITPSYSTEFFRFQLGGLLSYFREKSVFSLLLPRNLPGSSTQAAVSLFLQQHAMAVEAPEVALEADVSPQF